MHKGLAGCKGLLLHLRRELNSLHKQTGMWRAFTLQTGSHSFRLMKVAHACLQASAERIAEVEERSRELYDCNQRLEAHVRDLESRKRPPLYQKKQEEELKAAIDKAVEAETRAHEADLRAKEFKVWV